MNDQRINSRRNSGLRVKTFIFGINHADELDEAVNAFSASHRLVRITAMSHLAKIGYAVVYEAYTAGSNDAGNESK